MFTEKGFCLQKLPLGLSDKVNDPQIVLFLVSQFEVHEPQALQGPQLWA